MRFYSSNRWRLGWAEVLQVWTERAAGYPHALLQRFQECGTCGLHQTACFVPWLSITQNTQGHNDIFHNCAGRQMYRKYFPCFGMLFVCSLLTEPAAKSCLTSPETAAPSAKGLSLSLFTCSRRRSQYSLSSDILVFSVSVFSWSSKQKKKDREIH